MKAYGKRILASVLIWVMVLELAVVPVSGAEASQDPYVVAQEKIWKLINDYADPNYFLGDRYYYRTGYFGTQEMTDAQYEELHQVAVDTTKNATAQYDKIKAITLFVANHVYYDYKYLRNRANLTYYKPYDVYKYKRTTCSGYTSLTTVLLTSIGIPCMELYSDSHTFNAAYDSEQKRWVFIDTTWCSQNTYEFHENSGWEKKEPILYMFDTTPKELAKDQMHHTIYWVEGLLDKKYNSLYYRLGTNNDSSKDRGIGWEDTSTWYISVMNARTANPKAVSEIEGLKVRDVRNVAGNEKIKTLDLSETEITSIEGGAYKSCGNLTSVKFPASLTSIGGFAFYYCGKLKEIDLSGTRVSSIGFHSFYGCNAAKTISLPATVKKIEDNAFACYIGRNGKKIKTTVNTTLSRKKLGLNNDKGNIWAGRDVTLNSDVYTIKFIANGAGSGTMPDMLCGIGKQVKLSANKYKRAGYKFTGWNTKKNGRGKSFKNKAKVKNLAKKNKTIRLYAQWKKK